MARSGLLRWMEYIPTMKRMQPDLKGEKKQQKLCHDALSKRVLSNHAAVPATTIETATLNYLKIVGTVREVRPGQVAIPIIRWQFL